MLQLGNSKVNAIYEHSIVEPYRKPGLSSKLVRLKHRMLTAG